MTGSSDKAKAYQRKKQGLSLFHLVLTPALLFSLVHFPLSANMESLAQSWIPQSYGVVAVYFLLLSLYLLIFDFPFSYYSGFVLEHRYELSNQTFGAWLGDFAKKSVLSFLFSCGLVLGLYALIWNFPTAWWLLAWAGYAVVSYVIGKIFPVFIVPLFYKYGTVDNEMLKERIVKLAKRYDLPVKNVYSINLSKTTKKANAAFMGMGKTKRVVLSDTLIANFDGNEIEMVLAHELGHYKHKDVWKHLGFGLVTSFLMFGLAAELMNPLNEAFGFSGVSDVAGMPLLFLVFFVFSVFLMPLQNGFSRRMERAADTFALKAYPQPEVFVSTMEKLTKINLADPNPNPVYEWFFYNHPSISKRIKMARERIHS